MVELADDEAFATFGLAVESEGNATGPTLRAFTEPEFRNIIANLPPE